VRRRLVSTLLAAGLMVGLLAPVSAAPAPALPNSMAALGDSITRAYDVCCSYRDHPGQSWSTGGAWYDGISSHYERIKRRNRAITGRAHNDAVTGAKMSAAAHQASAAAAQHAAYVTVLLGANDLCTASPSTMTSTHTGTVALSDHPVRLPPLHRSKTTDHGTVEWFDPFLASFHEGEPPHCWASPAHTGSMQQCPHTFKTQFRQAMVTLKQELPQARIFVSSIPDIYQLWKVLHPNRVARTVWATAGICPAMLGASRTEAQRQQVVAREVAFNQILADSCHQYGANCRWDGHATYNYKFAASQVSVLDFFHPDLDGQAALARVTWAASWWPTT
jgi:predicted transglutaminase-like cysteine proteinase